MAKIEAKLQSMGLVLPERMKLATSMKLPFTPVRVRGNRAFISGTGPLNPDGTLAQPLGKLGAELDVDAGYRVARNVALAVLASLKRELGDLDRVTAWLRVLGMVNATPDFDQHPSVINGFSDLILELWGPAAGAHARSAVGMASLPLGIPVEIEAEVEIHA